MAEKKDSTGTKVAVATGVVAGLGALALALASGGRKATPRPAFGRPMGGYRPRPAPCWKRPASPCGR